MYHTTCIWGNIRHHVADSKCFAGFELPKLPMPTKMISSYFLLYICILNETDILASTILYVVHIQGRIEVTCTPVNLEFPVFLNLHHSNLNSILVICSAFDNLNIDFYIIYMNILHRELKFTVLCDMNCNEFSLKSETWNFGTVRIREPVSNSQINMLCEVLISR